MVSSVYGSTTVLFAEAFGSNLALVYNSVFTAPEFPTFFLESAEEASWDLYQLYLNRLSGTFTKHNSIGPSSHEPKLW